MMLSFEENYLFTKQEFEEILQSNPSLRYKTLLTFYNPKVKITEMYILISYYEPYVETDRNGAKIVKTGSSLMMKIYNPFYNSSGSPKYAPYRTSSSSTMHFSKEGGMEVNLYPISIGSN